MYGKNDNPFEFHESDVYVACFGDNGKLYAKWGFNSAEDALPWFLSLGDKVEVIEPPEMAEKIKDTLSVILEKYS